MNIKPTIRQVNSYYSAIRDFVLKPLKNTLVDSLKNINTTNGWQKSVYDTFFNTDYQQKIDDLAPTLSSMYISDLSDWHRRKYITSIKKRYNMNVSDLLVDEQIEPALNDIIDANVALIKSIPSVLHDQISEQFNKIIVEKGFDQPELTSMLTDRFGIATRRAKFIASDQSFKTLGAVNSRRQQQTGFIDYKWVNVGDSNVRKEHKNHPVGVANKIYSWKEGAPISEKHPGIAPRCRCFADPHFATNSILNSRAKY